MLKRTNRARPNPAIDRRALIRGSLDLSGQGAKGSLAQNDFTLETLSSASPLRVNDPPVQSKILFYVADKKAALMTAQSIIEISVADYSGRRYRATQKLGDWLQSASPVAALPPLEPTTTRIIQQSKDSDCSNILAGNDANVDCPSTGKEHDKKKTPPQH